MTTTPPPPPPDSGPGEIEPAGPIAWARAEFADLLRAATTMPVLTHVPERLEPPCVVITEGSPLAEPATTHSALTIRLAATVIAAPVADNALTVTRLDTAVDDILTHLTSAGVTVSVDPYTTVTGPDTQPYLAATIHYTTTLTLTKE